MQRLFLLLLSYLFIAYPSMVICKDSETGTLVVSYQTGQKGERLDRIRFLLTNDKQQQTMYPKKDCYAEDAAGVTRVVIVEDLAPGDYKLEFIIPNGDALFEDPPIKIVTVAKGSTVKTDQLIQVKYASIEATFKIEGNVSPNGIYPALHLKNKEGEIVIKSKKGILKATDLLPGEYLLTYEALSKYKTPDPIAITLLPNEHAGPFHGIYR